MPSEGNDRSTRAPEKMNYDFVEEHFEANGIGWGAGDLVMFGGQLGVLSELLAPCVSYVEQESGQRALHQIIVLYPPGQTDREAVVQAIGDAIARGRGEKLWSEETEILAKTVEIVFVRTSRPKTCSGSSARWGHGRLPWSVARRLIGLPT